MKNTFLCLLVFITISHPNALAMDTPPSDPSELSEQKELLVKPTDAQDREMRLLKFYGYISSKLAYSAPELEFFVYILGHNFYVTKNENEISKNTYSLDKFLQEISAPSENRDKSLKKLDKVIKKITSENKDGRHNEALKLLLQLKSNDVDTVVKAYIQIIDLVIPVDNSKNIPVTKKKKKSWFR